MNNLMHISSTVINLIESIQIPRGSQVILIRTSTVTMPGRLRTRRPSPTTVSFTVSNAPHRSSSPTKILFGIQILLRAVLFCCAIVAGLVRLRHLPFELEERIASWKVVLEILDTPFGSRLCQLVDPYNPWAVTVVCAVVAYGVLRRGYTGTPTFNGTKTFR